LAKPSFTSQEKNTVLTAHFQEWLSTEPMNIYLKKTPVAEWFMENRKTANGGVYHKAPIWDALDPVGGTVARGGDLDMVATDPVTHAEVRLVLMHEPVVIWLQDELEAMNGDGLTSLAETRVKSAMNLLWDNLESKLLAASTTAGDVSALADVVSATGTTSGIAQSTLSAWAAHTDATYTFTSDGPQKWRAAMRQTTKFKGVTAPSRVFVGDTVWDAIKATGYAKTTWFQDTNTKAPQYNLGAGPQLWFDDARVVHAPKMNAGTAYFLNENHVFMVVQDGYGLTIDDWFDMRAGKKAGRATNVWFFGQVFTNCRPALGKHTSIS